MLWGQEPLFHGKSCHLSLLLPFLTRFRQQQFHTLSGLSNLLIIAIEFPPLSLFVVNCPTKGYSLQLMENLIADPQLVFNIPFYLYPGRLSNILVVTLCLFSNYPFLSTQQHTYMDITWTGSAPGRMWPLGSWTLNFPFWPQPLIFLYFCLSCAVKFIIKINLNFSSLDLTYYINFPHVPYCLYFPPKCSSISHSFSHLPIMLLSENIQFVP